MSDQPVSIVMPSLDVFELLEANLPLLIAEVERRAAGDEVIVVDDTGRDALAERVTASFPSVTVVPREENGGFARALLTGVERARHELVYSMNTDIRVRTGFLEPLVECLRQDDVDSAVSWVLLNGRENAVESMTELRFQNGLPFVVQEGLGKELPPPTEAFPVAFPVGGAFLFRRGEFLARGGFDRMYHPFYWEDVDMGFAAWRAGRRVLCHPASVVEHHHRGTIGRLVPEEVFRAAIERNRLLFTWKFLDDPEFLREHLSVLHRAALDAWIGDAPEELVWINLALDDLEAALTARRSKEPAVRAFAEVCTEARPPSDEER